jgi:hypothetical protein
MLCKEVTLQAVVDLTISGAGAVDEWRRQPPGGPIPADRIHKFVVARHPDPRESAVGV